MYTNTLQTNSGQLLLPTHLPPIFFVTPTVRFYCYREMSIGLSTGISSWKDDLLAFPRFETSVYL